MQALDPSLVRFRAVVEGALAALESRRQEVNDLNVFPVADGDTGDNMVLTLRAVLDELSRLEDQGPIDEIGREMIVESVARAALLGARGNSGVILSQLVRGAAEELISRPGELVDPELVAAALTNASEHAYRSVSHPAEGTILTVAREMASRMTTELPHMPHGERRLGHTGDAALQNRLIANILARALETGEQSLKRGPELLPALREAGVVDAGAYGLLVVLAGCLGVLRGEAPPPLEHHAPARVSHPQHASSTYRYCTNFAVTGEDLDGSYFRPLLEQIGDSILVVGDRATLKVHVHTDDPERATAIFAEHGAISHLDVADMRLQVAERAERLADDGATNVCGVLAVVSGEGMAELFRSLGATPLDGGRTLNPSTYELLAGIHSVPAEEVVVLPNSSNVRMAAERAAELSDKAVCVVPSRSQQAGLAAAVALDATRSAEHNAAAMAEALENVRTGAVTEAARDDGEARFRAGEAIGFVDERLVAWGEPAETLRKVLDDLAGNGTELVTLIAGRGAPLGSEQVAALVPEGVEFELSDGGQPSYWWLLSAE
jgi:DAK2 domain fusion protein YloV